jgi:hypothetical protein
MKPRDKEATPYGKARATTPRHQNAHSGLAARHDRYAADRAIPRVSECQGAPAVRSLGRYRFCMRRLHIDGSTGLTGLSRNVTRAPDP